MSDIRAWERRRPAGKILCPRPGFTSSEDRKAKNACRDFAGETTALPGVSLRHWVALVGAMLGAFMAVLDIQITNASLKDILGSLGSTLDEGSWISTSYLVAEIVVIPLTGWLSEVFSPRRYLLGNAILFLAFSVTCAWSWNLSSLIIFRACQGFTGGVLIPAAFNLVLKLLPPRETRFGIRPVRDDGNVCSRDWSNHRRLANGQLRLAFDLLPELDSGDPADRCCGLGTGITKLQDCFVAPG
jgi:hypothetical protein